MAKYTIRICNYSFTISSDDDKNYMDNIATKVERRVKRLSDEMPSRNMPEVALFVAMDYCDQYMKSVGDGSNLRGQIKDYLQDGKAHKLIELKTLPLKTEVLDEAISYMLDEEMLVIKGANVTWNSD